MTKFARMLNVERGAELPARIQVCRDFGSRLRGLMFRKTLARDEGLLLVGARDDRLDSGIHMLFVKFDLAVFWISSGLEVVDKVLARSWHAAYVPAHAARYVLEIHPDLYSFYAIGEKVQIIDA